MLIAHSLPLNKNPSAGASDGQRRATAIHWPLGQQSNPVLRYPGESETTRPRSAAARIFTPRLDGIRTVTSPLPVCRKESRDGLPASKLAIILPTTVVTCMGPDILLTRTPPLPDSQRRLAAAPTWAGPAVAQWLRYRRLCLPRWRRRRMLPQCRRRCVDADATSPRRADHG